VITWHEVLLRLAIALALCGAIGAERYLAGKAGGGSGFRDVDRVWEC
jgi:uncharacterized membrane protein YhiD involved in acid resistance